MAKELKIRRDDEELYIYQRDNGSGFINIIDHDNGALFAIKLGIDGMTELSNFFKGTNSKERSERYARGKNGSKTSGEAQP